MEKATFAAGCFWGVEEAFRKIKGVISTKVGYTGGHVENPTYREVCQKTTGHAESIEIEFDPQIISYQELLEIFWQIHDPTSIDKQGLDIGNQYRSAIFYHNKQQQKTAELSKDEIQSKLSKKVVTSIEPAQTFYPAEEYHQKYIQKKNG
ncbi:MAG: peptide-methionine (S)-S-oxide reductase [Chlamydiae bacterium CG10_big_fil_rev_8_21_14_0_10_35_9]|nr:MAG: peptide-methionine (S)-S-oxide reductase [Chlamydiae bacterium CG10_big_fil_rev_8_21_14_0_10_35_9]